MWHHITLFNNPSYFPIPKMEGRGKGGQMPVQQWEKRGFHFRMNLKHPKIPQKISFTNPDISPARSNWVLRLNNVMHLIDCWQNKMGLAACRPRWFDSKTIFILFYKKNILSLMLSWIGGMDNSVEVLASSFISVALVAAYNCCARIADRRAYNTGAGSETALVDLW